MATDHTRLDTIRDARSELENHYIDELVAGRLSRRQFMRKGAVIGMSTGLMGAILTLGRSPAARHTVRVATDGGTAAARHAGCQAANWPIAQRASTPPTR